MASVGVDKVAKALNVTPRRVQQLVNEGMPREDRGKYDLGQCMAWYVRYLQAALEGKNGSAHGALGKDSMIDVRRERAGLVKADRELKELMLAQKRGQTAPIDVIRDVLSRVAVQISGLLDSLPLNIKRRAPTIDSETMEFIKAEIVRAQNACARTGDYLELALVEAESEAAETT